MIRVFADGAELDGSQWTLDAGNHIRLTGTFTKGTIISFTNDDEWKFGDILKWRGSVSEKPMMFICDEPDDIYVWVLDLADDGLISLEQRAYLARMDA